MQLETSTNGSLVAACDLVYTGQAMVRPSELSRAAFGCEPVKIERVARLIELQRTISLQKNRAMIGRTVDVLVESDAMLGAGQAQLQFGDSETEALYHTGRRPKRLPPQLTRVALRKLDMLEAAHRLDDLRVPPGNRLEALRGNWAGFHSIRVNEQWRIVFRWDSPEAAEVSLIDYHRG